MEYKKIGKRLKECREKAGFTQEALAETVGCSSTYISALERGAAFPRGDKLIVLLNTLKTSADSIFCDVVDCSSGYKASVLSEKLSKLPAADQQRILEMVELMIQQTNNK